jgi:twitching motility protein PilT
MSLDNLKKLLDEVAGNGLSDLHFTTGMVPYIRTREGEMIPVPAFGVVALEEMKEIASFVLPADRRGAWPEMKEMDASFEYNSARFRVNAYYETRGPSLAIRLIGTSIPSPDELGIPKSILSAIDAKHGLVLVTGATGSGKSTSLASLVEYINATRAAHIITIEDPIEYVFNSKKSLVHQREISTHTHSFAKAIRSSLREDPDVVVIGEMRDPETIAAAITLAETGHLVISTLHTNDTVQAIDRIIDAFPPTSQAQIRVQLGMSLVAIMSQALLPKKS